LSAKLAAESTRANPVERQVRDLGETLAPVAGPNAPRQDVLEYHRDKFRKLFCNWKGEQVDPDEPFFEQEDEEYGRVFNKPMANLVHYVEGVKALYEVALQEVGVPLTQEQNERLDLALRDFEKGLRDIPRAPAPERLIRQIEVQRDHFPCLDGILEPEQRRRFNELVGGNDFLMAHRRSQPWLWVSSESISGSWYDRYGFEPYQEDAVVATAGAFARALAGLRADYEARHGPLDQLDHWTEGAIAEFRIRALRAQVDALRQIDGILTPEQRENVRTKDMPEYLLLNR
jgi:hypothetical protein